VNAAADQQVLADLDGSVSSTAHARRTPTSSAK
jgi:hypothetical protein